MASLGNNSSTTRARLCPVHHRRCSTTLSEVIFVKNTPPGVTEQELFNYFSEISSIRSVKIVENPGGAPIKIVAVRCQDPVQTATVMNSTLFYKGYFMTTEAAYCCEEDPSTVSSSPLGSSNLRWTVHGCYYKTTNSDHLLSVDCIDFEFDM